MWNCRGAAKPFLINYAKSMMWQYQYNNICYFVEIQLSLEALEKLGAR